MVRGTFIFQSSVWTIPLLKKHKRKKKKIVCCDCGETFLFTGGEQKYYEERKLSEPKRCAVCRQKRKELFKGIQKKEAQQ